MYQKRHKKVSFLSFNKNNTNAILYSRLVYFTLKYRKLYLINIKKLGYFRFKIFVLQKLHLHKLNTMYMLVKAGWYQPVKFFIKLYPERLYFQSPSGIGSTKKKLLTHLIFWTSIAFVRRKLFHPIAWIIRMIQRIK